MAFIPNDPLFASTVFNAQTYLYNPGGLDLNVVDVWDDYSGNGVEVVVHDVGFDYTHEDLDNYRFDLDYDFAASDLDAFYVPDPDLTDENRTGAHGTPIMGIIGAAQDGVGTVGIAFDADLIGYRRGGTSLWDAALLVATNRDHDVFSMSQGFFDGPPPYDPSEANGSEAFIMTPDVENLIDALGTAITTGRTVNGTDLGLIVVKSAGNSRDSLGTEWREETTTEAMDSHRGTITVAGVNANGYVNVASSPGASVLISSFYRVDVTTDNVGAQGYNGNNGSNLTNYPSLDYTAFEGTSASAPQISGVVALMLEANPSLGWRDVQSILAYSARHVGSDVGTAAQNNEQATFGNASWAWNGATNWNGGGLHISNDYGFGFVDAKAAVRLAETWQGSNHSSNDLTTVEDALDEEVWISPLNIGFSRTFTVTESANIDIEHVTLGVDFVELADQHDLEIYVTSPAGTRIQLVRQTGDDGSYTGRWNFGATGFRGETSAGTWEIEIADRDDGLGSPIRVDNLILRTWGGPATNSDLFVFTNEFSDFAGTGGHSTSIAGGIGIDTLNAAAVDDADTSLNLSLNVGRIDGVPITISSIEVVYTGDGADWVLDGPGAETFYTGRGNDHVVDSNPSVGPDYYFLEAGDDFVEIRTEVDGDIFRGGAGRDTITWSQSQEVGATFDLIYESVSDTDGNFEWFFDFESIYGTPNADTFIEGGGYDIQALGGDDTVIVTSLILDDNFDGGDGFGDLIDWSGSAQANGFYNLESGRAIRGPFSELMANFEDFIGTDQRDIVTESAAINEIYLGQGDDTLNVITSIFGDVFDGGLGTGDLIDWSLSTQDGGTYDLEAGTAVIGTFSEVMANFEDFFGTSQDDIIGESVFANEIDAGSGDDTVRVITAIGADSFIGGFGNDTIDWSASAQADGVYDLSAGTASNAAGTQVETMFGFENFIGSAQSDRVIEGAGLNDIFTGAGDDIVEVHSLIGGDSYNGGAGVDLIDWSGSSQSGGIYDLSQSEARIGGIVEAMIGFENLIGTNQRDLITEGISFISGTNVIDARGGNDTVFVISGIGQDSFTGGFGNDTIDWSGSTETGGIFDLSLGTATNSAGTQNEVMFGFENFVGTAQRDILIEGAGANVIDMGDGNDEVRVNTTIDADAYRGGNGIDRIDWSSQTIDGARFDLGNGFARLGFAQEDMSGFESLYGTQGADEIFGSAESNGLSGNGGDDDINARGGDDRAYGGDGNDIVRGGGGNDEVLGDDGDDRVFGNNGNDDIFGGIGSDRLVDGPGGDWLEGGRNDDLFVIVTDLATDRIADFEDGVDQIRLFNVGFEDLLIDDLANGNVRVRYDNDVLILVDTANGLTAASLTEDDFLFVA